MRRVFLAVSFLLACGHPAAVKPVVPGPLAAPLPEPPPIPEAAPVPAPESCVAEAGPAAKALREFRAELLAAAAKDSRAFQASVQTRVTAFREKNRTVLAEQATWALRRLPHLALPELEIMPDDRRLTTEVAERIRGVLAGESDQDGLSFQSFMGLLSADPIRAFAGIRGFVLGPLGSPGNLVWMRENMLEGLAPPRIVRVNDDLERPVLAMPKRADLFVVWFAKDDQQGAFVPKRIRWVGRNPPAEPSQVIKTADDAFLSFATAVEASPPQEGDTLANLSMRALALVGELGKQWLDPYAPLLRDHGLCACRKLPQAPLPDLTSWKEEQPTRNLVGLTALFPRLRWDPLQAFLFLRTTLDARTMAVGDYSGLAVVDGLVPPTIARANDDPAAPVLFLVEGDTALVVAFSSTPERGYFPTEVRYLRRN
jgi:hypothetical protein